ncbi:hypothetical protein INT47_006268 [Mucor saturninus]|uniref:LIM zinc-binding domain-containing protein n=1 Tax=Mucor saturninus TaxID=64648 RepID=A0A8H7VE45_9FUNG|nr:hypothetical protein INT47_006268 [Mucor saturninus]
MPPRFGGAPKCPRCEKSVYMAEQVIGPGGPWHNYCLTCKECNKRLDSTTLTEKDNEAYCRTCYTRKWGPKGYGFAGGAAFLSTEDKMPSEILEEKDIIRQSSARDQEASLPMHQEASSPNVPQQQEQQQQQKAPPALPARREVPLQPRQVSPPLPSRQESFREEASSTGASSPAAAAVNHVPSIKKPGYISQHTGYVPRKLNFQSQNDICTGCKKAVYAAELVLGAGNKYHKACLKCCDCGKRLDSTNMVDRDFDLYCRGCYSKSFGPKGYGYNNLLSTEGATR